MHRAIIVQLNNDDPEQSVLDLNNFYLSEGWRFLSATPFYACATSCHTNPKIDHPPSILVMIERDDK
jgi:hypothetical protein